MIFLVSAKLFSLTVFVFKENLLGISSKVQQMQIRPDCFHNRKEIPFLVVDV